ncbi:MAG: hypothetical protein QW727_00310 [Candidatus Pacearchaeota archaeon]
MIKNMKPLALFEVQKYVKENDFKKESIPYFIKFVKIKEREANTMKEELIALNNHKIKEEHIIKIIDFLPKDASDVNKIFIDVSLDEDEIKQITNVVAKYK